MEAVTDEIYGCDVYAYLVRARRQLDRNENEALFYSAFELRCGIEARLQQYLDARIDIAEHKKKGWKLAASEKELAKAFKRGFGVAEVILSAPEVVGVAHLFHTPVRPSLVKAGEQLGDFLHAIKTDRAHSDQWWTHLRKRLEQTFQSLELASLGTSLAPPMKSPDGRSIHINAFYHKTNFVSSTVEALARLPKGSRTTMNVRYHLSLPDHAHLYFNRWRVDL
jgi:hypothetical protein